MTLVTHTWYVQLLQAHMLAELQAKVDSPTLADCTAESMHP